MPADIWLSPTATAEDAFVQLEADPKPSLVITDFNLRSAGGQMTGIDLIRALRIHENEELRTIPIILLSSETQEDFESIDQGIFEELKVKYVDKNTPPAQLMDAVAASLKT